MSDPATRNAVDTAAALNDIRERVAERARISDPALAEASREAYEAVEAAADVSVLSHVVPITADGGPWTLTRTVRRALGWFLRWQLQPMVERQNRFNGAAARALERLRQRQDHLQRRHHELETRIAVLEADAKATRSASGKESM